MGLHDGLVVLHSRVVFPGRYTEIYVDEKLRRADVAAGGPSHFGDHLFLLDLQFCTSNNTRKYITLGGSFFTKKEFQALVLLKKTKEEQHAPRLIVHPHDITTPISKQPLQEE
jgi:hypothetical protein